MTKRHGVARPAPHCERRPGPFHPSAYGGKGAVVGVCARRLESEAATVKRVGQPLCSRPATSAIPMRVFVRQGLAEVGRAGTEPAA